MLDILQTRASYPARQLLEPAPDDAELEAILKCGITAPDHAAMTPWRFITIRGDARKALGDVFARIAKQQNPDISEQKLDATQQKPLRSPLIVVIVATITPDHPKTPEIEQLLSAGAATTQILLGARAAGFAGVWLTGPNAYEPEVKRALGIDGKDHIVGFVYMGTPGGKLPQRKRPDVASLTSAWHGET